MKYVYNCPYVLMHLTKPRMELCNTGAIAASMPKLLFSLNTIS